jgi:hypothetical protein
VTYDAVMTSYMPGGLRRTITEATVLMRRDER